jgi:hypothetical protein
MQVVINNLELCCTFHYKRYESCSACGHESTLKCNCIKPESKWVDSMNTLFFITSLSSANRHECTRRTRGNSAAPECYIWHRRLQSPGTSNSRLPPRVRPNFPAPSGNAPITKPERERATAFHPQRH